VVKINTDCWLEELHSLVYHQDEPVLSATAVNHWFLMKKLREAGIKVIISGQGIDEVLYGYVKKLMGYHFADLIKNGRIVNLLEELFWHAKYSSLIAPSKQEFILQLFKGFFPQRLLKTFKARFISKARGLIEHDNIPKSLRRIEFEPTNLDSANLLHNAFFHLLTVESIPAILHYEDRNSMAFSIEQRVPFLDKEIISYLFSLPSSAKVRKGVSKWIFREALKGILPESVRTRLSKLSFSAPEAKWITSQEFQNYVHDVNLLGELRGSVVNASIFQTKIGKLLKDQEPYDGQYWRVYNYALWKKVFGI
jgi:asparagine synthase (glutamine-hydrolysing)